MKIKSLFTLKSCVLALSFAGMSVNAAVTLQSSTKIADNALHFDGKDIDSYKTTQQSYQDDSLYHYKFGGSISAHGDSVKIYKDYVFMTWYRGGKNDRHVMLSRLNTTTGVVKTIEFPHQHTGYQGNWYIGESHNTIGLTVSPKNGTIHMVYDMHAYNNTKFNGKFKDDYFRYSYSVAGAAEVTDADFTLEKQFVKDTSAISEGSSDYKHLVMTGNLNDRENFSEFTYPKFFETDEGDLLHYMRWGGNNNGAYYYNKYDADAEKWSRFEPFSHKNQKEFGLAYNWGLYGEMKYFNGKLRVGFQRRSSNNTDKFQYQNGIYYAYLDDAANNVWRDHEGKQITWPLADADEIKIFEPGDLVETTSNAANGNGVPPGKVSIVGGFDWAMTEKGDLHFIHMVKDNEFNKTVYGHLYKPAGASEFIHADGIPGADSIYAAGENIYIIGLENKKPYVEVAKGGTTTFTRIYTDTTTTTNFQHGVAYIKNGKVYYYLMEASTGTTRPIHIQVIDLGLEADAEAPKVSFPQSVMTVQEGYKQLSINVAAESPVTDRTIESVTLYLNDELVRVDNSLPYLFGHGSKPHETGAMGWLETHQPNPNPLPAGEHTFKAIALDNTGATSIATMKLIVNSNGPMVSFPQESIVLDEGFDKLSITVDASSAIEGRTIASVSLYIDGELVRTDDSLPYLFGHGSKPHETGAMGWLETHQPNPNPLKAGVYTFTAVAIDNEGFKNEAKMTVTVNGAAKPPIVTFPNDVVTVYEGYDKLTVTLQAESPIEGNTINSVTLYKNGELVRVDTRSPWNFGHSLAPYELGAMGWLDTHQPNPNPLGVGTHTFTAVAVDNNGLEGEGTMTLIVQELPAPTITFNESEITLTEGYEALSLSVEIETAAETVGVVSVGLYMDNSLIGELYEAPFVWDGVALLGLTAGSYEFKAVATDTNNRTNEAVIYVEVEAAKVVALLGDLDSDGDVDRNDVRSFSMAVRTGSITDMAYDFNNDGVINSNDVRGIALLCTRSGCATE